MAHQLLKKNNIKHLMLTQEPEEYAKYMDEENLVRLSWGELSVKYPDEIKTWHTGPEGHKEAYNIILTKLKENRWK